MYELFKVRYAVQVPLIFIQFEIGSGNFPNERPFRHHCLFVCLLFIVFVNDAQLYYELMTGMHLVDNNNAFSDNF